MTVCRYVERNALRAGLVERAEAWRWSSLWRTSDGDVQQQSLVLRRLRQSVVRSQPFGESEWMTAMIERFGLVSTIRNEGRPRKVLVENCS